MEIAVLYAIIFFVNSSLIQDIPCVYYPHSTGENRICLISAGCQKPDRTIRKYDDIAFSVLLHVGELSTMPFCSCPNKSVFPSYAECG
jgi:hypothetical protein